MLLEATSFVGSTHGPRLLVLGAIHGIEICGPIAINNVINDIYKGNINIKSGSVTFIPISNPEAYREKRRYSKRDMNRDFKRRETPVDLVDFYTNEICDMMDKCDVLLDLHSFKASGEAFVFVGPENNSKNIEPFSCSEPELNFAQSLGIDRMVYGWLAAYTKFAYEQANFIADNPAAVRDIDYALPKYGVGTTEYFRTLGNKYGVTVECGQHDSHSSAKVAEQCIVNAMQYLGISPKMDKIFCQFTESYRFEKIFLKYDVDDVLCRKFKSFEKIADGEIIGYRSDGEPLKAPYDGAVIFSYPDAKAGKEWIYFAKSSSRGLAKTA